MQNVENLIHINLNKKKVTRQEAEQAVRTLIEWIGDSPDREGLKETPKRVIESFSEFFNGYQTDPLELLNKTFEETEGYDDMIMLRDIRIESHCEHHMVPVIGKAHIAYLPNQKIVGISKLARVAEAFAKRLQIQEKLTIQIASAINKVLQPKGVGVIIDATHHCMTTRGVLKSDATMRTSTMLGCFKTDCHLRKEFVDAVT